MNNQFWGVWATGVRVQIAERAAVNVRAGPWLRWGWGSAEKSRLAKPHFAFSVRFFSYVGKKFKIKLSTPFTDRPPHTHTSWPTDLVHLYLVWELKGKNKNEPKQSKNSNWYLVGSCSGPSLVQRAFQVSSFPTPWTRSVRLTDAGIVYFLLA